MSKTGVLLVGIAMIGFGAFFFLKPGKDMTPEANDAPGTRRSSRTKKEKVTNKSIVDVLGLPAKTVKFFDQATTKAGLSAGLSPAQIFAFGRTGRINP